jgi:hypothetical protein
MRIDSSGNVGIGTNSPIRPLQIGSYGVTNGEITLASTTTGYGSILFGDGATGSDFYRGYLQYNHTDDAMLFATAAVERMRIDSSGNVMVNNSAGTKYVQLQPDGSIRSVHSNGGGGDSIYSAITGISNGYQISVTTGNAQTYKWHNGGTQSMTLDSSGQLGIGTSSPSSYASSARTLVLASGGDNGMTIRSGTTSTGALYFANAENSTSNNGAIEVDHNVLAMSFNIYGTGRSFRFKSAGTEVVRITSGGNVLIGTTTITDANQALLVLQAAYPKTRMEIRNDGETGALYAITFYNGNGLIGSITTSGSATSFNTSSDQRLKTNIIDAPSGNIDDIKVRSFDWIVDGSHQEYGMVAQELIEVAPYAVHQPQNPDEMMAVDYSKLVPMMIKEIQDLKSLIESLTTRLTALEGK